MFEVDKDVNIDAILDWLKRENGGDDYEVTRDNLHHINIVAVTDIGMRQVSVNFKRTGIIAEFLMQTVVCKDVMPQLSAVMRASSEEIEQAIADIHRADKLARLYAETGDE